MRSPISRLVVKCGYECADMRIAPMRHAKPRPRAADRCTVRHRDRNVESDGVSGSGEEERRLMTVRLGGRLRARSRHRRRRHAPHVSGARLGPGYCMGRDAAFGPYSSTSAPACSTPAIRLDIVGRRCSATCALPTRCRARSAGPLQAIAARGAGRHGSRTRNKGSLRVTATRPVM